MTDHPTQRRPAAFRLDDPGLVVAPPEPEPSLPATLPPVPPAKRGIRWGRLFWPAATGLVAMGFGLAVTALIESLFARSLALGWTGAALAGIAAVALLGYVIRETRGLLRLRTIETLRERAMAVLASDDRNEGRAVARETLALLASSPNLARSRTSLEAHLGEIIDGADLVRLTERELMTPLDAEAKRLISAAAKRVSLVTAISPRAAVDMLFVGITAFGLVRRLALLYGARPGTLGTLRLAKQTLTHVALTGGMAIGDSFVQQVLGHGVVAKLSARLGEGVLNGLLTARLGLAALEVIRPLPFTALPEPALSDLAGDLLRRREE